MLHVSVFQIIIDELLSDGRDACMLTYISPVAISCCYCMSVILDGGSFFIDLFEEINIVWRQYDITIWTLA